MLLIRRAGGQTEPDLEVLLREDLHYLDECVALGRVERNAEKQVILRRGPTQPGAEQGCLGKPCLQEVHHDLCMPVMVAAIAQNSKVSLKIWGFGSLAATRETDDLNAMKKEGSARGKAL